MRTLHSSIVINKRKAILKKEKSILERELVKNKEDELKSLLDIWGINKSLDIKAEDIFYETDRETHIWAIGEDYILKMTNGEREMKNNVNISKLLLKSGIPGQKVVETLKSKILNIKY